MHGDHIEYPSHALIDPNSKNSACNKVNLKINNVDTMVSDLKINQSFE